VDAAWLIALAVSFCVVAAVGNHGPYILPSMGAHGTKKRYGIVSGPHGWIVATASTRRRSPCRRSHGHLLRKKCCRRSCGADNSKLTMTDPPLHSSYLFSSARKRCGS
jgi:hypothetical protein